MYFQMKRYFKKQLPQYQISNRLFDGKREKSLLWNGFLRVIFKVEDESIDILTVIKLILWLLNYSK